MTAIRSSMLSTINSSIRRSRPRVGFSSFSTESRLVVRLLLDSCSSFRSMRSIVNGRHLHQVFGGAKDFSYFKSVRGYDRAISMKPQFGVCKNKVGCSFAYTGEKIPVPADSKCPECGQPLVVEASKQGGAKMLIVLAIVVLLLLI